MRAINSSLLGSGIEIHSSEGFGGSVWESNPTIRTAKVRIAALKAGKTTGALWSLRRDYTGVWMVWGNATRGILIEG